VFGGSGDDDEEAGEDSDNTETGANGTVTHTITVQELNRLLGHGPLRRLLLERFRPQLDDDDDETTFSYGRPRRRKKPAADRFPKVPSDAGRKLMSSGIYGTRDSHVDTRRKRRRNISERLMWRRLGLDPRPTMRRQNCLIAQELVPSTSTAEKIIHYDSRAYSGQFSDDGNFFFSCTQNFKVRMYDTSNPYEWKYYKTVDFPFGQWTITDATLSPDNRWLAYSSIRSTVCLASTDPLDNSEYTLLDFTNYAPGTNTGTGRGHHGYRGHSSFGIWSLRFSGDGREIVAGTSDHSVVVYDLETRQSTVRLSNHEDDVNAVCFGDKSSPHILYSGSDDQTLRVWDRRSMADGREAGVFVGHTEGLTYVDSKGDGRYVLSNGKDQMMKLWDLRKMMSPSDLENVNLSRYTSNFDYRFNEYDDDEYEPNPQDCSVVTFRGHKVLKTLIRCHFSPPTSSNSRYVYSGSSDGKVYIWNLDGSKKDEINVLQATRNTRPRHTAREEMFMYELQHGREGGNSWSTCVRDASWCPTAPVLAGELFSSPLLDLACMPFIPLFMPLLPQESF
jgi:DDB1- and CUL4-associated factor 11